MISMGTTYEASVSLCVCPFPRNVRILQLSLITTYKGLGQNFTFIMSGKMISQTPVVLVLVCSLGCLVLGHPKFMKLIPNGHSVPNPCANSSHPWHGVGHNNRTGGGILNVFGADFLRANMTWTPDLCLADSDIDGHSNGYELGDPDCKWVEGGTPETLAVSHPGVCEPMTSKTCMAVNLNIRCI